MLNLAFLTTPLGMLITGLAGIVALIDDYLTFMEGGESYFDWTPWADTIKTCVDWLQRAAGAIGTFMTEHQDLLMSVAKGIGVFMGIRGAIGMVIARDRRHEESLFRIYGGAFSPTRSCSCSPWPLPSRRSS